MEPFLFCLLLLATGFLIGWFCAVVNHVGRHPPNTRRRTLLENNILPKLFFGAPQGVITGNYKLQLNRQSRRVLTLASVIIIMSLVVIFCVELLDKSYTCNTKDYNLCLYTTLSQFTFIHLVTDCRDVSSNIRIVCLGLPSSVSVGFVSVAAVIITTTMAVKIRFTAKIMSWLAQQLAKRLSNRNYEQLVNISFLLLVISLSFSLLFLELKYIVLSLNCLVFIQIQWHRLDTENKDIGH